MCETAVVTKAPTKGGVIAYLMVDGVFGAAEFYQKAFGAILAAAQPVDAKGRTMHVHLYVNGSSLMLSDPYPEHGCPLKEPQGFSIVLAVDDIDTWWKRATDAGASVAMPVTDMFWGDRYGQLRDPYGIVWGLNQAR